MPAKKVSLAWANLSHDWVRLALFGLGIGFAVLLIFVQLGFKNALLDSNLRLIEKFRCSIVVVARSRLAMMSRDGVARRHLAEAASIPGVAAAVPVYIDSSMGGLRDTEPELHRRAPTKTIRVIGVELDDFALDLPELDPARSRATLDELRLPGNALFDRWTRAGHFDPKTQAIDTRSTVFGPLAAGTTTELAGRTIRLVGSFAIGGDFAADGSLIVSDDTFKRFMRPPYLPGGQDVDYILVRLDEEGARRPADVLKALRGRLDEGDVDVLTHAQLLDRERRFWLQNTPIGFTFGLGVIMGLLVGMVICYQILSSDVADHLAEYATLKAIGYRNWYLAQVVLNEAVVLAVIGFAPGLLAASLVYWQLATATGLPMRLTPDRIAQVFGLTVLMCVLPGLISIRSVQQADPADVF